MQENIQAARFYSYFLYRLRFVYFRVSGFFFSYPLRLTFFFFLADAECVLENKLDIPGQSRKPTALEIIFVSQGLCWVQIYK